MIIPGVSPELYPFTSHYHVQAAGHRLHYLDEGAPDAPPVVMVHGNPTWSFYYRNVVLGLKDRFRCLVPDHIGCGLSDRPTDADYTYTLESRVEDLMHWLDAVCPDGPVDLVVHDWGGAIGLGWATRFPERIRRLVILNTAAFNMPAEKRLPRSLGFARTWLGSQMIQRFNAFSGIAARVGSSKRLPPDVRRGLTAPYQGGPERRLATLRFVQDIPLAESDPAWPVLAGIEARLASLADRPILIGWGAGDFVFDDVILAHWRHIWPHAAVEYFEDAGHYVLEDAADRLVPMIRDHLTRPSVA